MAADRALAQQAPQQNSSYEERTVTGTNKARVEGVLKAWMAGDGTALQGLLDDNVEWTIAGNSLVSGTTHSRAELNAKVLGPFGARFSQSQDRFRPRRIYGIYTDGDTVIAHLDAAGVANDGKPYANAYVWILTMRGDKVVGVTAFFDSIAFDELWRRVSPAQN
jgi:ketosteroid isomerase-like protein